jgi:hypothetical protein
MAPRHSLIRSLLTVASGLFFASTVQAHHGFGLFQIETVVVYEGTITGIDLVNPHSYLYFDRVDENGETISMRCEMRAAILLRRGGWSKDMFEAGLPITVEGNPHRDDRSACYTENITIGDRPTINRNQQFTIEDGVDNSNRPERLSSGKLNISGDWAVELAVLTVPPSGGRGALVPSRFREAYAAGEITLDEIRVDAPPRIQASYSARGQESADAFEMWNPKDNPRLSCKPTSIIFDWTFDWPVNRITQATVDGESVIDIDYGLYSFTRRIHIDMDSHPANLESSYAGHSIGHWEGDTLVVDTIGFEEGVLTPPTRNSEQLHVVERYSLDTESMTLRREYSAEDPVYLAAPYANFDLVQLSAVAFERHPCLELTPEFGN